jgi:hypothetical protein
LHPSASAIEISKRSRPGRKESSCTTAFVKAPQSSERPRFNNQQRTIASPYFFLEAKERQRQTRQQSGEVESREIVQHRSKGDVCAKAVAIIAGGGVLGRRPQMDLGKRTIRGRVSQR